MRYNSKNKLKKVFLLKFLLLLSFSIYAQDKKKLDSLEIILKGVLHSDQYNRLVLDSLESKFGFDSNEVKGQWFLIKKTDSLNCIIVSSFLDKYGWPNPNLFSNNTNEAIFYVIQHSELNIQKKYEKVLEKAFKEKQLSPQKYANFKDRLNIEQGDYQIYGTQLKSLINDKLNFHPIYHEKSVNKRRKNVGLNTIQEYARNYNIEYLQPLKVSNKRKFIFTGYIISESGHPISSVDIYFGNNTFLDSTDKNGYFKIPIKRKQTKWAFIFRKLNYQSFSILLNEQEKPIHEMVLTLYEIIKY
jgi:hypothetical protein